MFLTVGSGFADPGWELVVLDSGLRLSLQALDWVCFVKISLLLLILNGQYSAHKKSIENIDMKSTDPVPPS